MQELALWVIYDHPRDFPNCIVARKWVLDRPTLEHMEFATLEDARNHFRRWGLVCLTRNPEDDAKIVETWL
jgi:hypothetical protein